jgi:hypothetical protein
MWRDGLSKRRRQVILSCVAAKQQHARGYGRQVDSKQRALQADLGLFNCGKSDNSLETAIEEGIVPFAAQDWHGTCARLPVLYCEQGAPLWNDWPNRLLEKTFWDRKVRIAILTLATFIALC